MAFDGLVTKSVVTELNHILTGGKINKVYEPNKNEIVLDIYCKEKFLLDICIDSANCRMNLTSHLKPNPKVAPNFCMLLRKYLNGAKILSFETYQLDRIIIVNLENDNELNDLTTYKLIVELMGKHSNILLVNEHDTIIDSLRHISSEQALRVLLPANPYTFPASDKFNLLTIDEKEFVQVVSSNKQQNLASTIQDLFTGVNNSFIAYTLKVLNISHNATTNDLAKLYSYLKNLIVSISENKVICKEFELENGKKDFCLQIVPNVLAPTATNSFIDEFYFEKENHETFISYRNNVLKLILSLLSKYNKKLVTIQEKLNECKNMEQYKLYGELITANLYKMNNNINIDSIVLENYYDNNKQITIPLDKKISPSFNAKKYFKKYHKLKNTSHIVTMQRQEIQSEIDYLESIVYALENSTSAQEVHEIHQEIEENILKVPTTTVQTSTNKKDAMDIPHFQIDGWNVYVGKNNTQNDIITFKMSDKNDVWFHVQGFHGSHVLLKTNGKEISDESPILLKCAKLAALHSKASGENKVLVDYTLVKNLKKPKGSKPGFVVFHQYKTIIVDCN